MAVTLKNYDGDLNPKLKNTLCEYMLPAKSSVIMPSINLFLFCSAVAELIVQENASAVMLKDNLK